MTFPPSSLDLSSFPPPSDDAVEEKRRRIVATCCAIATTLRDSFLGDFFSSSRLTLFSRFSQQSKLDSTFSRFFFRWLRVVDSTPATHSKPSSSYRRCALLFVSVAQRPSATKKTTTSSADKTKSPESGNMNSVTTCEQVKVKY